MKLIRTILAALALAAFSTFAYAAGPISYVNTPMDTPQGMVNTAIQSVNANFPNTQGTTFCTGTTTSTCQGTRLAISITGLTTADAGTVSAAMTVTDASVTAASQIFCQVMGYAGTGVPYDAVVIPGAGSFTFVIQNNSASAALNATVVSVCYVN